MRERLAKVFAARTRRTHSAEAAADAEAVLALARRESSGLAETIYLRVPGVNHAAIRFALGRGLRLASFSHFFTSAPFGRPEQCLPSGPTLFCSAVVAGEPRAP
ncbi:MAG TPA: hypothetical protein VM864_07500 [Pyrinomonadaceae bacterium]|nr:hypothetical protein [Pyrinomonadaceae bacterium]